MTVNGNVMPRPNSWMATVDSSHRPSRGSWSQKERRVVRGAEDGSDIAVDGVTRHRQPSTRYRLARRDVGRARYRGPMIRIGAHVAQQDPIAEATARGTDLVQFFLGNPQGYKGPEVEYAGGLDGLREDAAAAG